MPCSDVTEVLSLTLDHADRVTHYSLVKLTCGAGVGNPSLLRQWIERRPAPDVLSATVKDVLDAIHISGDTWNLLAIKHLAAVQAGIRALIGDAPSRPVDGCIMDSVEYGPKGIRLLAQIKIDVLTQNIAACGGCISCSSNTSRT